MKAAGSPDVREQLRRVGLEASLLGSVEFAAVVKRDIDSWAKIIKDVGAKAE